MTTLNRFSIGPMMDMYKFKYLVETGTGMGGSMYDNAKFFDTAYTFEVHKETFDIATDVMKTLNNVRSYNIESMRGLPLILPLLNGPTLFYLDARFPGMVVGDPLNTDEPPEVNVPVQRELYFLMNNRNLVHDTIIIGGWYIWEEGPYAAGPFHAREEFKNASPVRLITELLDAGGHYMTTNYADEGYLLLRPKQGLP